jgi:hypothetical protein
MTISFACPRCMTRFKVPESFGGKKARCKKCGHVMKVPVVPPPATSVATSGMFRLGAIQPEHLQPAHEATKGAPRKMPSIGKTSLRLAPVSLNDLKPDADDRPKLWEDADSIEYELEKPAHRPAAAKLPTKLDSSAGGLLWGRGGIAEIVLILSRKVSDFAYLLSIPFLLLILLAIVLKQRDLAIASAVVVIFLNISRLLIDGFALVALAFKKGPLQGVLFFIPPFTFYYLAKRGRVMKEALVRFLGPVIPLLGVVLLFSLVPWLRGSEVHQATLTGDRIQKTLGALEETLEKKMGRSDNSQP